MSVHLSFKEPVESIHPHVLVETHLTISRVLLVAYGTIWEQEYMICKP